MKSLPKGIRLSTQKHPSFENHKKTIMRGECLHSTEVRLMILTKQPRVCISMTPSPFDSLSRWKTAYNIQLHPRVILALSFPTTAQALHTLYGRRIIDYVKQLESGWAQQLHSGPSDQAWKSRRTGEARPRREYFDHPFLYIRWREGHVLGEGQE